MTVMQDDLDQIMTVMDAAFDPAFGEAWTRRQVEDALLMGHCHYRLASLPQDSSNAAGFFLSRHGFEEEELLLLAVTPPARRQGIANALLSQLARDAAQRGAQRLLLEMRAGNPAETLYRNHGFTQIGTRHAYYRAGDGTRIDALTFEKILTPQR